MKVLYSVDFESWAFPEVPEFLALTSEERKELDNGYTRESGYQLLELLEKKNQKITFFVVSQIYDWYPELIRDIAAAGHEIAFHNHTHKVLKNLDQLKDELGKGQKFMTDFAVKGYRAPAIVLPKGSHKILKERGLEYSSSVYSANQDVGQIDGVKEVPVSVFDYLPRQADEIDLPMSMQIKKIAKGIPFGSSYFTAMLGGRLTAKLTRKMEARGYDFVSLFIHNWQIFSPKNASYPDWKYLATHPMYWPYKKNVKSDFEYLAESFKFTRFVDFFSL